MGGRQNRDNRLYFIWFHLYISVKIMSIYKKYKPKKLSFLHKMVLYLGFINYLLLQLLLVQHIHVERHFWLTQEQCYYNLPHERKAKVMMQIIFKFHYCETRTCEHPSFGYPTTTAFSSLKEYYSRYCLLVFM